MATDRPRLGEYVLLGPLLAGRTFEVFRARKGGRLLALRLLRLEHGRDPAAVDAFVARGRAALQFRHAGLLRATQVGRADGRYFVATDYAAGQTLAALLERCRRSGQRLSLGQVVVVAQSVALAMAEGHGQIRPCRAHPGDVLIGYDGAVRLLLAEPPAGMPIYAAPEQVRGQEADESADQFVLAAMIFEMLTLEPAFVAENEFQSLEKLRRAEVPPPSLWNDRVPNEMDDIVRRAATREPGRRYSGVAEMAQALADLRKGFMFGTVDLADLLRRVFPNEVRAEEEARRSAEESIEAAAALRDRLVRAPRALGLGVIYWVGLVVMLAGAWFLATGR
jgi:eukaryotic-like serine/threonine-protein kinase